LREAEAQQIWRKLGFATALEYLEDVFAYAPRTALERLRVAKELADLPELEAEMRKGAMPYSAAKELSRVMTRATEGAWLARARGKNLRDIEELVAGHKKGDDPDAPKDPNLITRKRLLDLPPHVDALLEQCRGIAADERGGHIDDAALVELLCRSFLAGPSTASDKPTRPAHRVVIHKCEDCGRGWQQSRGRKAQLRTSELECAECDAEFFDERANDYCERRAVAVGTTNDVVGESRSQQTPQMRGKPNIPRRVRSRVWARDEGRCRVPGCRATRNLDVHHIVHRADGGTHDPENLIILCSGHHALHHEGLLAISGRAPDRLQFARGVKPLADSRSPEELTSGQALRDQSSKRSRFDDVVKLEHAKQALMQLGYKARAARKALEAVSVHVDADADIRTIVRAVLARDRAAAACDSRDVFALAKQALAQLGYPATVAARAVEAARVHVDTTADLHVVIREALRRCDSPRSD